METKVMIFTLPSELKKQLELLAKQSRISQGAICRIAISKLVGGEKDDITELG